MIIPTQLINTGNVQPTLFGSVGRSAVHSQYVHDGTSWQKVKQCYCHDGSNWVKVYDSDKIDYKSYTLPIGRTITAIYKSIPNNNLVIINYAYVSGNYNYYISTWDGITFIDIVESNATYTISYIGFSCYANIHLYTRTLRSYPYTTTYIKYDGITSTVIPVSTITSIYPNYRINSYVISKYGVVYAHLSNRDTNQQLLIYCNNDTTWLLHSDITSIGGITRYMIGEVPFIQSGGIYVYKNSTWSFLENSGVTMDSYSFNTYDYEVNYYPSFFTLYTYYRYYDTQLEYRLTYYDGSMIGGMFKYNDKFYYVADLNGTRHVSVANDTITSQYTVKASELPNDFNSNKIQIDPVNKKIYTYLNNTITVKNFQP